MNLLDLQLKPGNTGSIFVLENDNVSLTFYDELALITLRKNTYGNAIYCECKIYN